MRFAAALAACCLIVPITLGAAPGEDARLNALLDAIRTASGAPYRYHLSGELERTSMPKTAAGATLRLESEGTTERYSTCFGELCGGTFLSADGTSNLVNLNGTTLPGAALDARSLPNVAGDTDRDRTLDAIESYAFDAPDFRDGGGVLRLLPMLPRDPRIRIEVTAPNDRWPIEAFVDPATDLVVGARDRGSFVAFLDQRRVGTSVMLPFEIVDGSNVDRFTERHIEPEPLSKPAGLVPLIAGGSTTLPMVRMERPSLAPVVDCTIGTVATRCLLDTGNAGMSISLELAEQLGLEALPNAFVIHGLGSYATGVVRAPELKLGAATYPGAYYAILHDLHAYGYDLVLGADLFAHTRVALDYGAQQVTLSQPGPTAGDGLALQFQGFVPVARLSLGERETLLAIDTGDESTLNLSYEYFERFPNLFHPTSSASVSGIGGVSTELMGQIDAVRIGRYAVSHQAIGATKGMHPTADGHAGSGLLSHFIATFDYEHARLELTPRAGDAAVKPASSSERP